MTRLDSQRLLLVVATAASAAWFGWMVLGQLGHPLLWNDEGYTAEFGRRVLVYGYPKVHDGANVLYGLDTNVAVGTKEGIDAYLGTPWAHYYVAALGAWWAEGVAGFHEKTARLRAPFAIAGLQAVFFFLLAGCRVLEGSHQRRWLLAAGFLAACATSISLVLHLREVRYYALAVLWSGVVFLVEALPSPSARIARGLRGVALAGALILLYLTFFPSFFALLAALAVDRVRTVPRGPERGEARFDGLLASVWPLAVAAACVAPLMIFFETVPLALALSGEAEFSVATYTNNLMRALSHLAGHEALLPALAMRLALWAVERSPSPAAPSRRLSDLLWSFALLSVLLGARNPVFFERYYVALSPVLALAGALDAFRLWDAWPLRVATARVGRWRSVQVTVLVLLLAALVAQRAPYIEARAIEVREPVRGPLDYVVPYLAERYPDPSSLVIATNYEDPVLMYYLGSHVTIGFTGANLRRDREVQPDVIVPRRAWGRNKRVLAELLQQGEYERIRFPVGDLQYNNRPAVAAHAFVNEVPDRLNDWMEIFVRVDP